MTISEIIKISIVRAVPYGLLMWVIRRQSYPDGQAKFNPGTERTVKYFQISEGEFVVFSQEIQDVFDKRRESRRKDKLKKKLNKLNKKLRNDYWLKNELRKQFEDETDDERLGW